MTQYDLFESSQGRILCILEITGSIHNTQKKYWYYNIDKWLRNRNGYEAEPLDLECDINTQNWVKKYYFPKVGLSA